MKFLYYFIIAPFLFASSRAEADWNYQTSLKTTVEPQNGALVMSFPFGSKINRGEIEFRFSVNYNQSLKQNHFGLGIGWTYPFAHIKNNIVSFKDGSSYAIVDKKIPSLKMIYPKFYDYGSDLQKTPDHRDYRYLLTYLNGDKIYLNNNGNEIYNEDRHGNSIKIFYNSDNSIKSVSDPHDNIYTFNYINVIDNDTGKTSKGFRVFLSSDGIIQQPILKFLLDDFEQLHKIIQYKDNSTYITNTFLYSKLFDGVYTELVSATGAKTNIEYIKIPTNETKPVYSVSSIQIQDSKQNSQPEDNYEYTFANKNFTGSGVLSNPNNSNNKLSHTSTSSGKDFLYKTRQIRGSIVTEFIYNNLNLLLSKVIYKNGIMVSKTKNKYLGQNEQELFPAKSELKNNYNLLVQSTFTLCKNEKESVSESLENAVSSVENFFKAKLLGDSLSTQLPDCKGIFYVTSSTYDDFGRILTTQDKLGYKYSYSYFDQEHYGLLKRKEVSSTKGNKTAENYVLTENKKSILSKTNEIYEQAKWLPLYINQYDYFNDGEKKKSILSYAPSTPNWFKSGNIQEVYRSYTDSLEDPNISHIPGTIVKIISSKDYISNEERISTETYDKASGNLLKKEDGLNRTTQYFYDLLGNITKIIYPDDSHLSYYYMIAKNGATSATIEMNSYGFTQKYYYDSLGRIIQKSRIRYDGQEKPYEYYHYNQENQSAIQKEGLTQYSLSNSTGSILVTFSKDINGKIQVFNITRKDPISENILGNYTISSKEINFLGDKEKLLKTLTNIIDKNESDIEKETGILKSTVYEYNDWNQLLKEKNLVGDTINYTYNSANQLISKTLTDNKTRIYYEYNLLGKLRSSSIEKNSVVFNYPTYDYNCFGEVISKTNKLNSISYTYDSAGQLTKTNKNSMRVTEFTYDLLGRKIQEDNIFDRIKTNFSYGRNGKIESIYENDSEILYSYTQEGWLSQKIFPDKKFISYTYNSLGQKTSMINIVGEVTTFSYDSFNRLIQASLGTNKRINLVYDSFGNIIKKTYPNKSQKDFKYDLLNRPLEIIFTDKNNNLLNKFLFTYDLRGNLVSKIFLSTTSKDKNSNKTVLYEYDRLNRLIKESNRDSKSNKVFSEVEYAYNITNNLISKRVIQYYNGSNNKKLTSKSNYNYTYNSIQKLTSINHDGKIAELKYDKAWNPTNDENGNQLTYNSKNQLISTIAKGKPFYAYVYYPDGFLGAIYYGNNINLYYYDENGKLINEIDEEGKTTSYLSIDDGLKED